MASASLTGLTAQIGATFASSTVMVVSSVIAALVSSELPATSVRAAPADTCNRNVPGEVGVICTLNTPGEVSVTVPMVTGALPAFEKSATPTVAASMSSLKVTV